MNVIPPRVAHTGPTHRIRSRPVRRAAVGTAFLAFAVAAFAALLALPAPARAIDPGDILWTRFWKDPATNLMYMSQACPGGDVAVAGLRVLGPSQNQIVMSRYSARGKLRWRRFVPTVGALDDNIADFVVDRFGNAIVAGTRDPGTGDADILAIKLDPTGKIVWTRTYDGGVHHYDGAVAAVADGAGYAYVAADVVAAAGEGSQVMKLRPGNGKAVWTKTFTAQHEIHNAGDIALAASGDLYLTGEGSTATSTELILTKITPAGTVAWTREAPGSGTDTTGGDQVVTGPSGTVYVSGQTWQSHTDATLLLLKYTAGGAQLWRDSLDMGPDNADTPHRLAIDRFGNAFLVGDSSSVVFAPDHGFIVRWTPGGVRSSLVFPQGDTAATGLYGVTPDNAGGCYVAGTFMGNAVSPVALRYEVGYLARYGKTCTAVWERYYSLFRYGTGFFSVTLCPGIGLCLTGVVQDPATQDMNAFVQMRRR